MDASSILSVTTTVGGVLGVLTAGAMYLTRVAERRKAEADAARAAASTTALRGSECDLHHALLSRDIAEIRRIVEHNGATMNLIERGLEAMRRGLAEDISGDDSKLYKLLTALNAWMIAANETANYVQGAADEAKRAADEARNVAARLADLAPPQ